MDFSLLERRGGDSPCFSDLSLSRPSLSRPSLFRFRPFFLNPALPLPAARHLIFFYVFFSLRKRRGEVTHTDIKTEQKRGRENKKTKSKRDERKKKKDGASPASPFFSSSSSLLLLPLVVPLPPSPLLVGDHGLDGRLRLRPEDRLRLPGAAARDQVEVALALRRDAPALFGAVGALLDDADRLELLQDVADEAACREGVPLRGAAAGLVAAAVRAAERADAQALGVSFFCFFLGWEGSRGG